MCTVPIVARYRRFVKHPSRTQVLVGTGVNSKISCLINIEQTTKTNTQSVLHSGNWKDFALCRIQIG